MKYQTFKRINEDAQIFGLPFMIFFIVLIWTIVSVVIVMAAPYVLKVFWVLLYIAGDTLVFIVYKKLGLKEVQRRIELFFKNARVIKYNQNMFIKKIDLKL